MMPNKDFWEKFRPKYFNIGDHQFQYGDKYPFEEIGLTGPDLAAWQAAHPGQTYYTPNQMDSITSSGGGMTGPSLFDPFQNMKNRGARKKKRPGEKDPPPNTLFGTLGGLGGLFGGR